MIQVKLTNLMFASGSAYHISEGCDVAVDGDAWRILAIDHVVAHKRVLIWPPSSILRRLLPAPMAPKHPASVRCSH